MTLLRRLFDTLQPAAQPGRPAALRVAVGIYSAVHNASRRRMFRDLHRQDPRRFKPVGPVRALRKPLPPRVADALFDLAQVTNAAHTLGLAHRVTGPLNAALQVWTLSYRNSWGMILHNDNTMVLHQVVLGLGPSADALSVDNLVRRVGLWPTHCSRAYGAVAPTMNLATAAVYLLSGIAKVRSPMGWRWAGGRSLREQIAADAIRKNLFGEDAPTLAPLAHRSGDAIGVLAAGALVIELGAPLALADRRLGRLFSLAALGMHWGIFAIMGIKFQYNMSGMAYLSFFPIGPQAPLPR